MSLKTPLNKFQLELNKRMEKSISDAFFNSLHTGSWLINERVSN